MKSARLTETAACIERGYEMKYRWPEFCPSSDRKMRYQVEDRIMTIARRKCRWRLELYHTEREREN